MIIFVLIFAAIIRFISINQSLWLDEATSALTTKMSLADFFGKFMPGDFHPPLYYLALRMWSTLFGTSEVALRSLSLIFGIATIYIVYLIGRELVSKQMGIVASVLFATSGLHIYYSQEARMYSMSTFLVTLAVFSFVKIFGKESRAVWWALFSLAIGGIVLTDYLPILIIPVFWVMGIFSYKNIDWWKRFVVSHIIVVVLGTIWLPTFLKQLTSGINVTSTSPAWVNVLGKFSLKEIFLIPVKFEIGRVSFDKYTYIFVVGILTLIFGFLIYTSRKQFKNLRLIWLWLLVPILASLLISLKLPVLNYFRFLFVLPALYLIIATGITILSKRIQKAFLFVILGINLFTSGTYLFNVKFQREDWRSAVKYINSNKGSNSEVVFPANSQMEAYRYYDSNALLYGPSGINKKYTEIWLVRYVQPISDSGDHTRVLVESSGFKKSGEYDFNGVVVWKYNK
ncbi:MAG TPA: glycosyltransferase family 39 protein [Candidatus Saccharimonadales bacterium]|nr:glycosyltransferase family 39 protein [Candidatus Saccharimonadales bacterium]